MIRCRWCNREITKAQFRMGHDGYCLGARYDEVYDELTNLAKSYNENQLVWSIEQAKRWRSLPGKGWQFLDMVPMVEYIGKVKKTNE